MSYNRRTFIVNSSILMAASALFPSRKLFGHTLRQQKPKNILLRSGWATANIGDIGHTPGTLRIIEQYLPDVEVTLWPLKINEEVEAMLKKRFPKVKFIQGTIPNDGSAVPDEIINAFKQTDLFIYNSGMHFNHGHFNYDWNGKMAMLALYYICKDVGKPYGLYGHSFDKFAPPSDYIFRDILNDAAFIYCRDSESLKYLQEHNVKAPVMEFAPDGCFGIDTLDEAKAVRYLKANQLQDKKFMAVVIRTNTPRLNAKSGDFLNPYNPTPEQAQQDQLRMGKIREIITAWVRQTKMKVLLAPEVDKEMSAAKNLVYDNLEKDIQPYIITRNTFWNADEALSVYKRAHSVVGVEPHSLIMALAVGVPIIHACPFGYGKKGWMFKDIGLPEWLFDIDKDPASDMTSTLMAIHKDYKGACNKVDKAMAYVKDRQKVTMQVAKQVLSS